MNRKLLASGLAALLSVSMLAGCGEQKNESVDNANTNVTEMSLQKVLERGYFTIGFGEFAPMGYTNDAGEAVGFDIDLANAVADKIGVEVRLQPINWDSKKLELSSGSIDVIWNGFSINDERRKEILFSNPYLSTKQSIVVRADSDIARKADLAGKRIAIQSASTSEKALKADEDTFAMIGGENLVLADTGAAVLLEVQEGRADAAVIDEIFTKFYLEERGMSDQFKVLEEGFGEEDYGVGGRLGDYSLMEAINKALDECKAEGITSEISMKWFGENLIK